jgi:hypothetical protein
VRQVDAAERAPTQLRDQPEPQEGRPRLGKSPLRVRPPRHTLCVARRRGNRLGHGRDGGAGIARRPAAGIDPVSRTVLVRPDRFSGEEPLAVFLQGDRAQGKRAGEQRWEPVPVLGEPPRPVSGPGVNQVEPHQLHERRDVEWLTLGWEIRREVGVRVAGQGVLERFGAGEDRIHGERERGECGHGRTRWTRGPGIGAAAARVSARRSTSIRARSWWTSSRCK